MSPTNKINAAEKSEGQVEVEKDEEGNDVDEEVNQDERGRGKRKRRESKPLYEPFDFTMTSHNATANASFVAAGRGKKLGEIAVVNKCMNKYKLNSDELTSAYKFIFSNRGIANKKLIKQKLLDFSGYLAPLPKGNYNEEKQDEDDEVVETKYATKAFKMNISAIKTLCEFFSVDCSSEDGKPLNKDETIDRLLDFLGAPHESMVKEMGSPSMKKKPAPKSKKKAPAKHISAKRKSVAKKVTEDPFSLIKDFKKGKIPSDDAMRQWVKAYLVTVDLENATTKHAMHAASAKFGVDMKGMKGRIKELLAEEM